MSVKQKSIRARVIKSAGSVTKSETVTQVSKEEAYNAGDWITPPIDLKGLRTLVKNSAILPQCIRAYKNNIAGFGIGIRYREDIEETDDMRSEEHTSELQSH